MRLTKTFAATALLLSLVTPALAGVITFDEFAADNDNGGIPAARYASMGVTFVSSDDGSTWGGLGAGDPGSWGLHGTNGSTFSGHNGSSYSAGLLFAANVTGVSLDASRSNGSTSGNTFTLEGWLDGVLVDSETVTFGAINDWSTVSLTGIFDELRWSGAGTAFHPYGVDNIRWDTSTPVSAPGSLLLVGLALGLLGGMRRRVS